MKLTKSQLIKIIKEELSEALADDIAQYGMSKFDKARAAREHSKSTFFKKDGSYQPDPEGERYIAPPAPRGGLGKGWPKDKKPDDMTKEGRTVTEDETMGGPANAMAFVLKPEEVDEMLAQWIEGAPQELVDRVAGVTAEEILHAMAVATGIPLDRSAYGDAKDRGSNVAQVMARTLSNPDAPKGA